MEGNHCNMPYVPLTTYECTNMHKRINCYKLLRNLKEYEERSGSRFLTKRDLKRFLAHLPAMPMMQYLLATSNYGPTLNPHETVYDLKWLRSYEYPEDFFNQMVDALKKAYTPLRKPFRQYSDTSYDTNLEKENDFKVLSGNISQFYRDVAGGPVQLHSKNVATQTVFFRDYKPQKEQKAKVLHPFLPSSYSDESVQEKPYDFSDKIERARSLFKVYYHTPFDSKKPQQNIMGTVFTDTDGNEMPLAWLSRKTKKNSNRKSGRKSTASVWQRRSVANARKRNN